MCAAASFLFSLGSMPPNFRYVFHEQTHGELNFLNTILLRIFFKLNLLYTVLLNLVCGSFSWKVVHN